MRALLRWRYGATLPDDDAGREGLFDLLLPISIGFDAKARMLNVIEVWSPWMECRETADLVNAINRVPIRYRRLSNRHIGQRQHVTNEQRELLKLRTITPCDMTDAQWQERRKARHCEQERRGGLKPAASRGPIRSALNCGAAKSAAQRITAEKRKRMVALPGVRQFHAHSSQPISCVAAMPLACYVSMSEAFKRS